MQHYRILLFREFSASELEFSYCCKHTLIICLYSILRGASSCLEPPPLPIQTGNSAMMEGRSPNQPLYMST